MGACALRDNFYFLKSNELNNVPAGIAIVCGVVCVAALVIIALFTDRRADTGGAGQIHDMETGGTLAPAAGGSAELGVVESVWEGGRMRKYWNPEKGIMWAPLPPPIGVSNEHRDGDEVGASIYHYLFSK